jgi:hypothetical protein
LLAEKWEKAYSEVCGFEHCHRQSHHPPLSSEISYTVQHSDEQNEQTPTAVWGQSRPRPGNCTPNLITNSTPCSTSLRISFITCFNIKYPCFILNW